MKRRELITLIGSAAAWPIAARAQQRGTPVIGFLDGQSFDAHLMTAFRQALKDAGYIEGRHVEIYFRSADGQTDRLVTLAGDIVGRRVAAIVTTGGGAAALAAYRDGTLPQTGRLAIQSEGRSAIESHLGDRKLPQSILITAAGVRSLK